MQNLVDKAYARLIEISDRAASQPIGPGEWSRKQIIGHLIDSACNNHQRLVRAQWCEKLDFPSYQQEEWVACQDYNRRDWHGLLDFWKGYNQHITHIMAVMEEEHLGTSCVAGWLPEPDNLIPLSAVIEHYWEHLEGHVEQILA
jgi:hypothetical protein